MNNRFFDVIIFFLFFFKKIKMFSTQCWGQSWQNQNFHTFKISSKCLKQFQVHLLTKTNLKSINIAYKLIELLIKYLVTTLPFSRNIYNKQNILYII